MCKEFLSPYFSPCGIINLSFKLVSVRTFFSQKSRFSLELEQKLIFVKFCDASGNKWLEVPCCVYPHVADSIFNEVADDRANGDSDSPLNMTYKIWKMSVYKSAPYGPRFAQLLGAIRTLPFLLRYRNCPFPVLVKGRPDLDYFAC